MYVIALAGEKDSGKSHTLNIVYQLLLFDGYKQVENLPLPYQYRILGNPIQKDFTDILEKKGKLIGFATMGDYYTGDNVAKEDTIKNLLEVLFDAGCTIALCACKSKNPSNDKSKIQGEIGLYPNIIIEKSPKAILSKERIVNNTDAQNIFNLI